MASASGLRGIKRRLRDPNIEQQCLGVYNLLLMIRTQGDAFDPSLTEKITLTKTLADLIVSSPQATEPPSSVRGDHGVAARCGALYILGILCCYRKVADEGCIANTVPIMCTLLSSLVLRHLSGAHFPAEAESTLEFELPVNTPFGAEPLPDDLSDANVTLQDLRSEMETAADALCQSLEPLEGEDGLPCPPPVLPGCGGIQLMRVGLASVLWVHDTICRATSQQFSLLRAFMTSGAYEAMLGVTLGASLDKRVLPELRPLPPRPKRSNKKACEAYDQAAAFRLEHMVKLGTQLQRERRLLHVASCLCAPALQSIELGELLKLHVKRSGVARKAAQQCSHRSAKVRARKLARSLVTSLVHKPLCDYLLESLQPSPELLWAAGGMSLPFYDLTADCYGILFQLLTPRVQEMLDGRLKEAQGKVEKLNSVASLLKEARLRKQDSSVDIRRRLRAAGQEGRWEWESQELKGQKEAQAAEEGLKKELRKRRRELATLLCKKNDDTLPLPSRLHGRHEKEEAKEMGVTDHEKGREQKATVQDHRGRAQRHSHRHEDDDADAGDIKKRHEERQKKREIDKAKRALQEAKDRKDLAARLYEGWQMNREDAHAHKVYDEEKRLQLAAREIAKVMAFKHEHQRLTHEQRMDEEEEWRSRREAEAKKIEEFRLDAEERRHQEEKLQESLQLQLKGSMERWRREKFARDTEKREQELLEAHKAREREARRQRSQQQAYEEEARQLQQQRQAFACDKDRLAQRLREGRFKTACGKVEFEDPTGAMARRKKEWVAQRLAEAEALQKRSLTSP